jgi:hypothetical protein
MEKEIKFGKQPEDPETGAAARAGGITRTEMASWLNAEINVARHGSAIAAKHSAKEALEGREAMLRALLRVVEAADMPNDKQAVGQKATEAGDETPDTSP